MKKSVSLSLSGIILATSLGMPYTQAKASTNTQSAAIQENQNDRNRNVDSCLLYTSPSPRDRG